MNLILPVGLLDHFEVEAIDKGIEDNGTLCGIGISSATVRGEHRTIATWKHNDG